MAKQTEICIRSHSLVDLPFIFKCWIRTALAAKQFAGLDRPALVVAVQETIMSLLDRGARIDVAVWEEDPTVIAGFVCYDAQKSFPLIHFVYVKDTFRNTGIGSTLVCHGRSEKPGRLSYTFKNKNTKRVIREGNYRPFLVRNDDHISATRENTYDSLGRDS